MRACLLAVTILLAACSPSGPDARETSRAFWAAVASGDLDSARALASRTSASDLDDWDRETRIRDAVLGEALTNESQAVVETSLVTERGEGELSLVLQTHLVREQGAWRVDVRHTRDELTQAQIAAGIEQVERAVAIGVQQFGKALEEGVREFERAMREALEELEQPVPDSGRR